MKRMETEINKLQREKSTALMERAMAHIPGGVNSPVRAFRGVGGSPVFMQRAAGAWLYDEDGNRYLDYINSWGPMILGHAWAPAVEAIADYAAGSTSFGTPTELEIRMAELIKSMAPGIDLIRMVNSGTEACMSALRLARGFTGRNKFIKFSGCYHGHADPFLVNAGSGVATLGIQSVPGVPASVAADTLTAPYNNREAVSELMRIHGEDIACIIVEPVAGNMGCVPPEPGFLQALRTVCDQYGSVLIFDEVMTGFRLAPGGAQQLYGVTADLVTYGKIIGGGLPVGAFGGRKDIMEHVAPVGKVYQAGTLSGNPIAMAAGFTLLSALKNVPGIYTQLEAHSGQLAQGLQRALGARGIEHTLNRVGSMMSVFFGKDTIRSFEQATTTDTARFARFFHHLLNHEVYLPPSAFESWFISSCIGPEEIARTVEAVSLFKD